MKRSFIEEKMGIWSQKSQACQGVLARGKTRKEAIQNIKEAISCYINALKEDGLPIIRQSGLSVDQFLELMRK